jgi:hypothetical protein
MLLTKALRFVRILNILVVVLPVCGLQLYGQGLDPRTPLSAARAAARRTLARQAASNQMVTAVVSLPQAPGTFISFDAPGGCQTPASFPDCTTAVAINPSGEILGYSVDANGIAHAFLRDRNGTFTSFDVPGAVFYINVTFVGSPGSSLNPSGEATGGYNDANGFLHGFVRDNHGAITTFDPPDAVNGTFPLSINAAGEVTGYYVDAKFAHGFLRDANGHLTVFDAPGAGTVTTACFFGLTYPQGINAGGKITGQYYDPQCRPHGFLRERNGAFTVVDVPNSLGTFPSTINEGGQIAGNVVGAIGGNGFIRDQSGSLTTFNVPGVGVFGPMDLNSAGVVVGSYLDENLVSHSFRRTPDGTLTIIDFPGAGTGFFDGTYASSINAAGVITGAYSVAGANHGFLFLPQ